MEANAFAAAAVFVVGIVARTDGTLHADLGHIGSSAQRSAHAPEVAGDEEQGRGEGDEQKPQKDGAGLQLTTPLLVVGGAEGDVAGVLVVLQRGRSRR